MAPIALLTELTAQASAVRAEFADLFGTGAPPTPIPFFGSLMTAKVLTIGLNPSDGEFIRRGWPDEVTPQYLCDRLLQYFSDGIAKPHRWFETWSSALSHLGVSYQDGSAAHVDICPWATRPMSTFPDYSRFTALVEASATSFERSLLLAADAKLILMAGAVNKQSYLNEFVSGLRFAGGVGLSRAPRLSGPGFVQTHRLHARNRSLPVFFCSVSPSSRTKRLLPQRIEEHSVKLKEYLV